MRYPTLSKEKMPMCPVFRSGCIGKNCSAFEIHNIEKPKLDKTVKGKRKSKAKPKVDKEQQPFCGFFKLYIKPEAVVTLSSKKS